MISCCAVELFHPHGARFFFAHIDGGIAAAAVLHSSDGVMLVDNVVTLPQHRRRGVATALMRALLRAAAESDAHQVFLFAAEDGDAHRMYARLGFRTAAISAQFHRDDA